MVTIFFLIFNKTLNSLLKYMVQESCMVEKFTSHLWFLGKWVYRFMPGHKLFVNASLPVQLLTLIFHFATKILLKLGQ